MIRIRAQHVRAEETIYSETRDLRSDEQIEFIPLDTTVFKQIKDGCSVKAAACIYCGSTNGLTKEHVIPHGLNGTSTIANGSCSECQRITHKFEQAILRGELQETRYKLKMSSRSKHKNVKLSSKPDDTSITTVFPIFPLPNYFNERADNGLRVERLHVAGNNYDELKKNGYKNVLRPLEFARLVAKVAYSFAWSTNLLQVVSSSSGLVETFMRNPSELGRYVGTRRPPYRKANAPGHFMSPGCVTDRRTVYVNVQLFAERGAPIYIVALGDLKEGWIYRSA